MKLVPRWPDLRLRMKGLIVVAVPATATVVIACAALVVGDRFVTAEQGVNHTLQIGQEIQRLNSHELESGVYARGYFLTGDEAFLTHAREFLVAFDVTRQKLALLTVDNPSQVRHLDQVAALERSMVEHLIGNAARFQVGALPQRDMRAALTSAETERLELKNILKAMQTEEDSLLEIRMDRLNTLRTVLRSISVICVFLGVTGGVLISILFASGITRRIEKLQCSVARLATGEVFDPLPQGRDEIGDLSLGMVKAAEILRHRTIALENASNGVAETDAAGKYVSYNRAFNQLMRLDQGSGAETVRATVHPEDQDQVDQAIARMRATGRDEIEVRVVQPEGRLAHIGMTFVPVSQNRDGGYFVFLHDINRRKDAEAAMVEAKDAALAGSLAKNDFLAKISHDIRTPLNAILGSADLLSQSLLNSDQAECVGMFQRNCRRLVALINDFLDFSKIEAGVVRVENIPYCVREVMEEVVATFRESACRIGLELGTEIGADVPEWELGDPLRVHQVLLNLLGNAVKFTQHGRVDLRVSRIAASAGEQLLFSVSDTGSGIRVEDQKRIFAKFEQAGKPSGGSRVGCGLGLAICQQLVDLMGGEIGVNSQEGSGSTFFFSLPLLAARPGSVRQTDTGSVPAFPVSPSREALQSVPRVLIAEDADDNRLLVAHYLRGEAVDFHFAENGQQAVDAICNGEEFDLILMDLDMPVLDGLGAVNAIRAWERDRKLAPLPIVALSAHAMRQAVRECLDAGCAAHVAKPVDKATLLSTIRRYHRSRATAAPVSEQVAALVPSYLAAKLRQTDEALASLEANDFEPIRRFGHNLKGTGHGYGFPRLGLIGAELEKSAIEHDQRITSEQLEVLRQFLVDDAGAVPVEMAGKAQERREKVRF